MEPSRNEILAVGLTNVKVSERRSEISPKKLCVLRNTSPNATDIITIMQGDGVATANLGIVLRQYEQMLDASGDGYVCWQGTINAICATATGQLSIFEK